MKCLLFIVCCLLFDQIAKSQGGLKWSNSSDSIVLGIDTIFSNGSDYTLSHYHVVSHLVRKKILSDEKDSIFNEEYNKFSRLIFTNRTYSFNIPTIPLTNIIFLENAGMILGLSKITFSPYHIVIYSIQGKLLYKSTLTTLELKVNKEQINNLLKLHPDLIKCFKELTIVKENDYYFFEPSSCFLDIIGRDSVGKIGALVLNHYFPLMSNPMPHFDSKYRQYNNSFSSSDPLYDLILIGSVPYLLILNSEDGRKVNIPLKSNCDILKEIE